MSYSGVRNGRRFGLLILHVLFHRCRAEGCESTVFVSHTRFSAVCWEPLQVSNREGGDRRRTYDIRSTATFRRESTTNLRTVVEIGKRGSLLGKVVSVCTYAFTGIFCIVASRSPLLLALDFLHFVSSTRAWKTGRV